MIEGNMKGPYLFVSHVSENRSDAEKIVSELERRNAKCWIAPRDIPAGSSFDDAIAHAIENCSALLLVFSDKCNESDYIRREVTVAGEEQKLIIPLRIEKAEPKKALKIRLSDLHWIDAFVSREQAIDETLSVLHEKSKVPLFEIQKSADKNIFASFLHWKGAANRSEYLRKICILALMELATEILLRLFFGFPNPLEQFARKTSTGFAVLVGLMYVFVLAYAYCCLYAQRFRDFGANAWWAITYYLFFLVALQQFEAISKPENWSQFHLALWIYLVPKFILLLPSSKISGKQRPKFI
jgi:uncharacterized membrane protein YhaH (DUF805 family)